MILYEYRLGEFSPNEVPKKKTSPIVKFGMKFGGITQWMLEITVARDLVKIQLAKDISVFL